MSKCSGTAAFARQRCFCLFGLRSFVALLLSALILLPSAAFAEESTCYGTTGNGRLENGVRLPFSGGNFDTYSTTASLAGRTYVHSKVRDVVVAAFKSLEKTTPGKVYVYGETGFSSGGTFKPHKTHQNGLSVDFMVPVLKDGKSVPLPTSVFNKLGYAIEFNAQGRHEDYVIDYEAIAAHLVALHKSAEAKGVGIWRVIFDPELQLFLFETEYGAYLKRNLAFSKKRSWVRHDEHYHVDFVVECESMGAEG